MGITHAAFLIGTDFFEYGNHLKGKGSNQGNDRRRGYERDSEFDWDKLVNKLNGSTWTQPDELEECIIKDGGWKNEDYDVFEIIVMVLLNFVWKLLEQIQELLEKSILFLDHIKNN